MDSPKLDFCHIFLTVGVKCLRLVCHHKVVILISGQIAICVSLKNFLWIILGELETRMVFLQPVLSNFVQSFFQIVIKFIYWVSQLKSMRVTRRIVSALLTKVLYKFGCFKEKVWSYLKFCIWKCYYFTELPWDDFASLSFQICYFAFPMLKIHNPSHECTTM